MKHILIIEEDKQTCVLMKEFLEQAGYDVSIAPDSRVGLRIFRQKPASIVVTNVFNSNSDGFGIIFELRQESSLVRIIAISTNSQINSNKRLKWALRLGADIAMMKPVKLEELHEAIESTLMECSS